MIKKNITIIILLGISLNSYGQTNFPIKLEFSNEATAVPFTRFISTPIHPTFQVGTEYYYQTKEHFDFYQTANLGYIFHNYLYQGFYLNSGIAYDYNFNFGLKLKSSFELGYLKTFTTQDEYQLHNGEYVNGTDLGNSRLMPQLSLGVGYEFKKNNKVNSEIYILYKSWVEYPYSPGFIPVMTHINFGIGYKQYINWNNEK